MMLHGHWWQASYGPAVFTTMPEMAPKRATCNLWCSGGNPCALGAGHLGGCVCGVRGCSCRKNLR